MRMLTALVALALPVAAFADEPVADLDTAVQCAVLFGIVAGEQQRGTPQAGEYPPLAERGREFFVQTGARLIDERALSREQAGARIRSELDRLSGALTASPDRAATTRGLMGPCLVLLDSTVPPVAGRTP
jgi:hypothetical protein